MAGRVTVNGLDTWYDEAGAGPPLVLLHGGMSDSEVFATNLWSLSDAFRVLAPERRGHGRTPDVDGPYTVAALVDDTVAFVEAVVGGPVRLAGYSMGAAVALAVALARPDLVERLVLVSGVFDHDGFVLPPPHPPTPLPPMIRDRYAQLSPDPPEHLVAVQEKVASVMETVRLTPDDLARIRTRTLVMAGDDDLVHAEHTLALARGLGDGELCVVPRTSHLLLVERPDLCTGIVREFLTGDAGPTYVPIRRVPPS
jgi:pimeloyl-ACP methyl ester carboxylesterase